MRFFLKKDELIQLVKYRKIQFDIVTIFLFLLLVYATSTIWYSYQKDKEVVLDFSQNLMKQVSHQVIDRFEELLQTTEHFAEIEKSFIPDIHSISLENKDLISFMLNAVKLIPDLTILHIATIEGTWIGVFTLFPHSTFRNDPSRLLPEDYKYAIQFVDRRTSTPKETWIYKNENGDTVSTEQVKNVTYDPRGRPWFIGAINTKKPFWSPVYIFAITKEPGISLGWPIFDSKGNLFAVSGGDIELRFISRYLSKQPIGKSGRSMIFTEEGFAIAGAGLKTVEQGAFDIPKLTPVEEIDPTFTMAYHIFSDTRKESFEFMKNDTEYIASVTPYQPPSLEKWLIAIVVPAKDFLEKVIFIQKNLYIISISILVGAMILVAFFSKRISRPIVALADIVNRTRNLDLEGEVDVETSIKEIHLMKLAVSAMRSALKSFGKYVPKDIVFGLMQQGKEIQLGGERKEITILFSDIYDFTTISESLPAETVMQQLSAYYELLSNIILKCNGTIDKYIGDGIMAFWGAPSPVADHAFLACRSALLCQNGLLELNSFWKKEGLPLLITRIGIHGGTVIVGNIGTTERMNYTIMGDPVNLASRLETINKVYKTKIIISEEIYLKVGQRFLVRPLDVVAVKGKIQAVKIYELIGQYDAEPDLKPSEDLMTFCTSFEKAFDLYQAQQFSEAAALFNILHQQFPDDYPVQLYIERCQEALKPK